MRGNILEFVRVMAETRSVLSPIVEIESLQVEGVIYSADLRPLFPGKDYIGCPEGLVVTSSVMDYPVHECPADYWRFTPQGFDLLLKAFTSRRVYMQGRPDFPHSVVGVRKKGGGDESLAALDPEVTNIPGTLTWEVSPRIGPDYFRLLGEELAKEEQKKYPGVMLHVAHDQILRQEEEIERLRAELRRLTVPHEVEQ
jgi:hypothetical protein